jgi:type I restriction enzyme S subunit
MDGDFNFTKWEGPAALLNQRVCKITIRSNNFVPKFLEYVLPSYLKAINENTSSVTVKHLSSKSVGEIPIPLPPLAEQRRITAKLETLLVQVNAAKDHLAAVPPITKRFRQSVLAAACSGRLIEDWRREHPDVETASELLKRIREERIRRYEGECQKAKVEGRRKPKKLYDLRIDACHENYNDEYLPSTWKACYINDIGDVCNGSTPSRKEQGYWDGDVPWICSGEVENNAIFSTREKITETGFKKASLRLLPKGTVLLAMIGEGKTRGQSAILNIEATINQNIAAILINHSQLSPRYLQFWFQFQYRSTREAGSGSGPKALNCQRVRSVPFNLPPLLEQRAIVNRIETLFHRTSEVEERVAATTLHADRLTQSILAKAFRGELVPQDPEDEPASVLLERIRKERTELKKKKKPQKRRSKTQSDSN